MQRLELTRHENHPAPKVMGILNVTPDSFSDGGKFQALDAALTHVATMVASDVDIIDIGGVSTRPGAIEIASQQELDRVMPAVEAIAGRFDVPLSIDTSTPRVMRAAVGAGACMINDVFALRRKGALEAVAELGVPVCLMHMQGEPGNMQDAPHYASLPEDIVHFLEARIAACVASGIERDRLIIDPGFGFGKNDRHNLQILRNLEQFTDLGVPLLVGLSRKRVLGSLTGKSETQRCAAGVAAAVVAMQKGANIIRTHDVEATVDAIAVLKAIERTGQER